MTPKVKIILSDQELAEKTHKYAFGGEPLPGATSICGLMDSNGKSSRMAGAAARITREGGNYSAEWTKKRNTGTRVHNYIERWLRGEDVNVKPEDMGYMDAAEKYLLDFPHERLHVERVVVGNGWGGRLDTCGEEIIEDWKTGAAYDDHIVQQSAYFHGLGFARYDIEGAFAGIDPMPTTLKGARCVYLHDDGTYDHTDYTRSELIAAYEAFEGLLAVHRWLNGRKAA